MSANMKTNICQDDVVQDETAALFHGFEKQAFWGLCPYGCFTEPDGSGVIFDRSYRPIVRVRRGGNTEIVPPNTFITFTKQRWFHRGFGMTPDAATREIVTQIIATYKLAPELRRRAALLRRGELPRWSDKRPAA